MCCMRLAGYAGPKKIAKNSPSGHHRTTLPHYIFATKACIDNRKKIVKQQYLPHMSSQYCDLLLTNGRDAGNPANFNGFCVLGLLAALLHGTLGSGRQPNFAALNRGRHLYSAGRPSRWALAHILVSRIFFAVLKRKPQYQIT